MGLSIANSKLSLQFAWTRARVIRGVFALGKGGLVATSEFASRWGCLRL